MGGLEKTKSFWEVGGRVAGWAARRERSWDVGMPWAEQGLAGPVPGPGLWSVLKQGLSWRCRVCCVCGAQPGTEHRGTVVVSHRPACLDVL